MAKEGHAMAKEGQEGQPDVDEDLAVKPCNPYVVGSRTATTTLCALFLLCFGAYFLPPPRMLFW